MSAPDIVSVQSLDYAEHLGTSVYYLPTGSASSQVDDLVTLLSAFQAAAPVEALQTIERFTDSAPSPDYGTDAAVSIAASLTFTCDDTTQFIVYVLGPVDDTFLGDGTVDDSQAWVADLIAWLLANGVNAAGSPFSTYDTGSRVQMSPGWLAVTGAAAYATTGPIVAEFYAQDGADVEGRDDE